MSLGTRCPPAPGPTRPVSAASTNIVVIVIGLIEQGLEGHLATTFSAVGCGKAPVHPSMWLAISTASWIWSLAVGIMSGLATSTGTGRYLFKSLTPANDRHKNPRPNLAERPGISWSKEGCGSLVIVGSLANGNDRSILFRHHVIPIDLAPLISRWRTAKVVLLIIDLADRIALAPGPRHREARRRRKYTTSLVDDRWPRPFPAVAVMVTPSPWWRARPGYVSVGRPDTAGDPNEIDRVCPHSCADWGVRSEPCLLSPS
jgi:hypothetical protein